MSLFQTKQWWRTVCGVNESFDRQSLLVGPLFGQERKDVIVVTSHSGYLRIYKPSAEWNEELKSPSEYKSTDLIIETQLCDCIIDAKIGKFVSGSQDLRLAIITPSKLVVYTVKLLEGSTEHGHHCELDVAYEHALSRFPASLITGPFGGVRGRDFLCVQCLDGTLLFYEQEVFTFSQSLANRLLPEPIVYVSRNDLFVTTSSAWILECYRYQSMAESNRNKERTEAESGRSSSLEPDWSFNIGEAVLDINIATLSSFEVGIVVLGERNLYCLKDTYASLKYAKRLEYKPLCFRAYVIEPDGKLMVLVVADTKTLMVYEGTTLKWSAQLPFTPVAIARAHFQHLQGLIVILSEDGHLEACYLGSEPTLFIAPPLHRRGYDYVEAERELSKLRSILKKRKASGSRLADATTDTELIISVNVNVDQEIGGATEISKDASKDGGEVACKILIEFSSYATLHDVQICIGVCKPLSVANDYHVVPNLCDRHVVPETIYIRDDSPVVSSEIKITASYLKDDGSVRVVQKTAQLPLGLLLKSCPPENTSTCTATIKCNEPLIGFTQLFPELTADQAQRQNWNPSALGLRHAQSGHVVTIVSGSTSNRYRVQSNDGPSMTLVLQQLVNRLRDRTAGTLVSSISQNHFELVHGHMDAHFSSRQRVDKIMAEVSLLTSQLRNIERRMLRAVRERTARPLSETDLPFLLEASFTKLFALLDDLAVATAEREQTAQNLWRGLRLLLVLLKLNANEDKYGILEAAIGFEPQHRNDVEWEEIADVSLAALLRSVSRKSAAGLDGGKPIAWNKIDSPKDLSKLKKRLVHAVERLDSSREADIPENEASAGADSADSIVPA